VLIAKVTGPELASASIRAEPLTVGVAQKKPAVHPGLWIGAGVCFLAAVALWMLNVTLGAIIASGAGALILCIALILLGSGRGGIALIGGKRLGKGPYVRVNCAPGDALIEKLSETINKLRETAFERQLSIDWSKITQSCTQAEEARSANRPAEAVRDYCRAITEMMQELRSYNRKKASDSSVL
jgi:hypothetical protein